MDINSTNACNIARQNIQNATTINRLYKLLNILKCIDEKFNDSMSEWTAI